MTTEQIPLFEGYRPEGARLSITGGFATVDGAAIPTMKIGTRVRFLVEGEVTSVKHKLDKDGGMERQHVVVLDGFSTGENPPGATVDDEDSDADRDLTMTISHATADGEVRSVETTSGALQDMAEEMSWNAPDYDDVPA